MGFQSIDIPTTLFNHLIQLSLIHTSLHLQFSMFWKKCLPTSSPCSETAASDGAGHEAAAKRRLVSDTSWRIDEPDAAHGLHMSACPVSFPLFEPCFANLKGCAKLRFLKNLAGLLWNSKGLAKLLFKKSKFLALEAPEAF